ncbi:restriction endonuclease subunit S [Aequorivita sinensis]|uniref:restriction endonuclease subunit S n=1 Tax=Aequorivita sinensis TaxID=1382458 RepID=UPI00111EDC37|nr:restriction endonuclease subunit S [Aequorivita sinensis]
MREEYKNSPIGEFPKNWEVVQLNEVLTIGSGRDYKHLEEGDIPVYGTGGYMTSVNEYLYDGESVGIGRKGTIDKPVFLNGKFWTVDTLFYTHSFKEVLPYYIYLVFQSINWRKHNEATGVPSLSRTNIEKIKIPKPPLPEQQKIAEILSTVDEKIEAIDQRIAETQALKKGLMQQLLTKGIGHTKFKDSPLGEIPESWELVPIYELRNKADRYGFTGGPFGSDLKSEHYTETGVKILQLQNIGEGKFIDKGITFTSEEKADELFSCNIFPGDIILAKMAPVARSCKVPFTDERYVMCSDGIRLSVDKEKFNNEFVFQAINSKYFLDNAEAKSTGTTRARIGLKDLKLIPIAVPKDIKEQVEIAEILSSVDEKIQIQQDKKAEYQELKKGLMQQLLTGKIRVKV